MNPKQREMLKARHNMLCIMAYAIERAWAGENTPPHVGQSHDRLAREAQALQDVLDADRLDAGEPWRG